MRAARSGPAASPRRSTTRVRGSALTATGPSIAIRSPFSSRTPVARPPAVSIAATRLPVRILAAHAVDHLRERGGDVAHSARDDAAADVLDRRDEEPGELPTERIVGSEPRVETRRGEEEADLGALEGLLGPRSAALQLGAVTVGALAGKGLGERTRRAEHGAEDFRPRRLVLAVEAQPRLGVLPREGGDAPRRRRGVAGDHELATVGEDLCPVGVRSEEAKAVAGEAELLGRRPELGDEIAAGVDVGEKARSGELLGTAHAADRLLAFEDEHPAAGSRQVAGAGQPVVSRADNDGIEFLRPFPLPRATTASMKPRPASRRVRLDEP